MGMYDYIERKVAQKCYDIAIEVRDSFTKDIKSNEAWKHSGAVHVAAAIKEAFNLDKPYRDVEEEND